MDDGRPVPLIFRGRSIRAKPGVPLLTSLSRWGLPTLQRSIRYHRPRAPFCGVGFCTQCLVRVNGVPNVRACRYVPNPNDRVETENAWPSSRFDLLGILDLVFRDGLDTLHGFRRPAFASPLYHRVVRRLAGYGRLPDASGVKGNLVPGDLFETDVLVIGAGRAGRAATQRLTVSGAKVTVVERNRGAAPVPGATLLSPATVVFLPPPRSGRSHPFRAVVARDDGRGVIVAAQRVLVATGSYDAGLWFGGSDRPGVLTADGASTLVTPGDAPPFRNAIVFGGGERVAELLDRWGDKVEAVVAPGSIHGEVARRASALDVPLYPRTLLVSVRGRSRVRSVELAPRGGGASFSHRADAVIVAHRRLPHVQLFFQSGARMEWLAGGGAYYPHVDANGGTTVPGLFAAGEAAGIRVGSDVELSGQGVADAILGRGAGHAAPARIDAEHPGEMEGYYRELLVRPRTGGKWVACACEDVLLEEVEEASRRGFRGIEVIKRYTSLGTGLCQGRYCIPDTLLLLARLENRPAAEVGYITQRPPVVPVGLQTLAGLPDDPNEGPA